MRAAAVDSRARAAFLRSPLLAIPSIVPCARFSLSLAGRLAALVAREKVVESALRAGKPVDAARAALENPPLASKSEDLKARNFAIVMKAIVAVGQKDADVGALVAGLDLDLADALMKYIVRGLARPDNAGLLFKLHAALVEKMGPGSVIRAIVDRKTA